MKKSFMLIITFIALVALACTVSGGKGTTVPSASEPSEKIDSPQNTTLPDCPAYPDCPDCPVCPALPEPTATPMPSTPVGIHEGLASLDSYIFTIRMLSTGPTASDFSETINETHYTSTLDATYTRISSTSSDAENPERQSSIQESYRIGSDSCNVSEEEYTYDTQEPAAEEMSKLLTNLLDFYPVVNEPVFVGEEVINGISSNHFSFFIPNLGTENGLEATINEGNYWIAVDGRYLVKYSLVTEIRSNPDDAVHTEVSVDLTSVNQSIEIVFPQGCITARDNP